MSAVRSWTAVSRRCSLVFVDPDIVERSLDAFSVVLVRAESRSLTILVSASIANVLAFAVPVVLVAIAEAS